MAVDLGLESTVNLPGHLFVGMHLHFAFRVSFRTIRLYLLLTDQARIASLACARRALF